MKESLRAYLFTKGCLVSDAPGTARFETLFLLAHQFNIRITAGASLAHEDLIPFVAEQLGRRVPAPFYRNFPQSVRELSTDQLLFDQLVHYTVTYGFENFTAAGHSLFEENFERLAFAEKTEVREFELLNEEEATLRLHGYLAEMLKSTRPLSPEQYEVLLTAVRDKGGYRFTECACVDTAIRLLLDTRSLAYTRFLKLSQVIKLVERLNYEGYENKDIKKLNLKNQDRKFITGVLDRILARGNIDLLACYEKKKVFCGLLHHIHYKPKAPEGEAFVHAMRNKTNMSINSAFERMIAQQNIPSAVAEIKSGKGSGALLRHLNYLISRCKTERDVRVVLEEVEADKVTVLIQMLMQYGNYRAEGGRTFTFSRFNLMVKHKETPEEQARRRSILPAPIVAILEKLIREKLAEKLKNRLGKVYIDEAMHRVALPLKESSSTGGYGVLPKGSRLPLESGRKIRAFTYWEKVNDIDLSVIGLTAEGEQEEFSWRTMYGKQSEEILFSGDQTSGFAGGSEYFDIDYDLFREKHPAVRYLVFCDNVFTGTPFSECVCRAGYMVRDRLDSGEVFEPLTVKSSFPISCDSTFAYLFGIDLETREFVWLNTALESGVRVAGTTSLAMLTDLFRSTSILSLADFFALMATEIVTDPAEADVALTDAAVTLKEGAKQIRSCDFEAVSALMA